LRNGRMTTSDPVTGNFRVHTRAGGSDPVGARRGAAPTSTPGGPAGLLVS